MIIGIEMLFSVKSDKKIKIYDNFFGFILFGLSVSVDSFTTGIGLAVISNNYIVIAFLFMLVSFILTYFGLVFGNKLSDRFGEKATLIGGIFMCILAIYQFL